MTPNNYGKITVERCRKIKISDLLKQYQKEVKEAVLSAAIEVDGTSLGITTSQTGFGGVRHWFQCPLCDKRVGTVYVHPVTNAVGCRTCLGVTYRQQRFKGMAEENI
jgi:hypothetical protein